MGMFFLKNLFFTKFSNKFPSIVNEMSFWSLSPTVFGTPTPPLGATPTLLPGQTQSPGAVGYSDLVAPEIGYFVAFPREVQPGEASLAGRLVDVEVTDYSPISLRGKLTS